MITLKCSTGKLGKTYIAVCVSTSIGFVFLFFQSLYAIEKQQVIPFFENDESVQVLQGVSYFFDETQNVTAEKIVEQRGSFRWLDSPEQSLNLFYSDDALWLSFFVLNASRNMRVALLEVDWPFIDNIELYRVGDDGSVVLEGVQGDHVLSHDRPLTNRAYLFPQKLEAQKKVEFLMRISTTSLILLPIELWSVDAYWESETATQTLLSLFFCWRSLCGSSRAIYGASVECGHHRFISS